MAKKKSEHKQKSFGDAIGLKKIISNEKADFLIGLLFVVAACYIIIAMISFLNTGAADQSLLENLRPGEWLNHNREFQNRCASIGAIIGNLLITRSFGLPSFLIPMFFAIVGVKLMRVYNVNLWKWFFSMSVILIWGSITFAKFLSPIMSDQIYNPGGNHGLYCVQHLENIVGAPGLTSILLLVAIAFLTFLSSETIITIRKMLNPVKFLTDKIKLTVTNNEQEKHDSDSKDVTDRTDKDIEKEDFRGKSETTAEDKDKDEKEKMPAVKINNLEEKNNLEDELKVEIPKEADKADSNTLNEDFDITSPINPREPFVNYKYPSLDLLDKHGGHNAPVVDMDEIKANNEQIVKVLKSFGVEINEIKATIGPTITLYEITPAEGVRISKIKNLEDDIALSLAALGIRIIAPIPGKGTIGIEVPNRRKNTVPMESVLNTRKFKDTNMDLPIAIGKTITNDVYMVDLAKVPHLLVAGATGQGKSVGLNAIITSLLYKKHPNELKFVLVDPKKVEFSIYSPIADHFMATLPENDDDPIITDVTKVVRTLKSLCTLMDHRYDMLKMAQVRNIKEYNQKFVNHQLDLTKGHEYMPYIVIVIDEFGDLIMTAGREVEMPIARIAQLARAVGMHMVIATQRPTTSIITGNIKANFPGRIAFKVSAVVDSRTILDRAGANQLIGRGDMLILNGKEPDPVRVQCAFVDTPEVGRIVDYISHQPGPVEPMELPEPASEDGGNEQIGIKNDVGSLDPLFEEAARCVVSTQQGSTSMIQRRFSIGYNRAGRLMDQLEKAGVVGQAHGSKPREVLVSDDAQMSELMKQIRG